MTMEKNCLRIAFLLSFAIVTAPAQVSTGELSGIVVDAKAGAVPNAKVTAASADRAISRTASTDNGGAFRITALPPGVYTVRVEAQGFATRVLSDVPVQVGEIVNLNPTLEVGAVATELTVTASVPVVETERTQQATRIDMERIENLPINRRNYLDFALLAPGVVETNDLVDSTDFRVVQTPQSGLSFGGSNGRGNNFTIDGVENYLTSGGVRPSVSQEAVQEFQISRNSFSAETGNSSGGAINIITRAGTNDVHGDLFGFFRHRAIQARNFFDPQKAGFTRAQYGATLGAPVVKDKAFLFLSFERLDRHESAFVPILQDRSAFGQLTSSQQQLANFFTASGSPQFQGLAVAMRQYLITNNFPGTLALFNANSGTFPFSSDTSMVSARLDHRFSVNDSLFVRGNFTGGSDQNAQFGALIGFNRGRTIGTTDGSLMLNNTWIINNRLLSETRLMFGYDNLNVIPTDPYGPDITISGYGSFGREIFLPSITYERHYQVLQGFDYVSGHHNVKFGADIDPVRVYARSDTFFGGRFLFSEQIPLGALFTVLTKDPNAAANLAASLAAAGQPQLIANLSQPITSLQAYNLGLPTLYQQGFGNPNWTAWFKNFGFYLQDTWKVTPKFVVNLGARYDVQGEPAPLHTDTNNIAPRVGIAWTLGPNGKTVIRAGYGLFYSQINAQIANLPATLNGTQIAQAAITPRGIPGLNNPLTGQPLTSFDIYQVLAAQGIIGRRTITVQDIAQFGLRPGPNAPGRVIFGVTGDYVNPYSQQASFEIERAVGGFALSAGYEFNRGARLPRILDRNLYYTGHLSNGQPTFGFFDPTILQYNVEESTANSFYHALILQATRRFSRHVSLNTNYTFSKAIDEVTDFNSDFEPQDQLNAKAERALSAFDQRHRLVVSSLLESPAKSAALKDFTLAPILIASSGRPFNILTGFDNLGDNHPTTHRPWGAGRDIGRGPDYFTFDLRLARRFPFGAEARHNLEFTAEAFNLLNRTNFRSINNIVGNLPLSSLPSPIVGRAGIPTNPLSFTSAFDPRQFQFGLKINF